MIAARIFDVAIYDFRPSIFGIRARLKSAESLKKQIAVYIAGPFGNFIIAACLNNTKGFLFSLFEANLAIGAFNILPMHPLDGGQIFIIILYKLLGSKRTFKVAKRISSIIKTAIFLTGLIQLVLYVNPSLLIAAMFIPGGRLLEETISIMNLESLLNRKQRIRKKKLYPVREFAAMGNCSLLEVMQRLDYDCFHIVYILNEDMKIIGRVTEQDIINAIQTNSYEEKIYDVFKSLM